MAGRTYKTAQGVIVDIDQMRLLNERTVAVGNMGVNARGDRINSDGSIKESRNEIMKKTYRTNAVIGGKGGTKHRNGAPNPNTSSEIQSPVRSQNKTEHPSSPPVTTPSVIPAQPLRGSLAQSISDVVPTTKEPTSDLLTTSTNTRTIKRI